MLGITSERNIVQNQPNNVRLAFQILLFVIGGLFEVVILLYNSSPVAVSRIFQSLRSEP